MSQVFQVQVGTGSSGVSGRIPQPSKAAAAFESAGPTKSSGASDWLFERIEAACG